ncbi:hypothetical protein GCM10018962_97100 [Dactylosporangium matsuzakiense]|uniref:YwqJ-like deaminase n=2 Tax=Dactylosporangium matsuzakiense TaxID=53360 RepID=A0A9W6KUR2_9ACTN|nr:hypothetical protein GCM10017581_093140 [Dactylosporangium matsuzakiense]
MPSHYRFMMSGMTRATPGRRLPLTAGALLVGDTVYRHTSVRGDTPPELHALIRRFLHELPVGSRERYAGNCAEMVLVSDRLHAAERLAGGAPLTPAAARAQLWGARLSLVHIREHGDPKHATAAAPCRTCTALLDWLGIEIDDTAGPETDGPATDGPATAAAIGGEKAQRARMWGLALASHASPAGHQHPVAAAAMAAFTEFGGQTVRGAGAGAEVAGVGIVFDPLRGLHAASTLAELGALLGARLTPIGEQDDGAGLLAVDEQGRVFVVDHTADWYAGASVGEAIATLLEGRRPARVTDGGAWA